MYAINLADWHKHRLDYGIQILLLAVIDDDSRVVECERRRPDGVGVVLDCDDERAAAIVTIVRQRLKKHQLRFYKNKSQSGKSWKRV